MVDKRSCTVIQVVFYCHFPDLLLAKHTTILRRLYRKPIDLIEELTTGLVSDNSFYFFQFLCCSNITVIHVSSIFTFLTFHNHRNGRFDTGQ